MRIIGTAASSLVVALVIALVIALFYLCLCKKKGKCDGMLNQIGGGFVEAYLGDAMQQNGVECFGLCCELGP